MQAAPLIAKQPAEAISINWCIGTNKATFNWDCNCGTDLSSATCATISVGNCLETHNKDAADRLGYWNNHVCVKIHIGLAPRAFRKLHVLQGDRVCLDMACTTVLAVIFIENANHWSIIAVEELNVNHIDLLKTDVERVFKLALGIHRNHIKLALEKIKADDSAIWINDANLPIFVRTVDATLNLTLRASLDGLLFRVISKHKVLTTFGYDEEQLSGLPTGFVELARGHATIDAKIKLRHKAVLCECVKLKPSGLAYDQVQLRLADEVTLKHMRHIRRFLRRHHVLIHPSKKTPTL
mmetsp:Transcript_2554/g.5899  ORF Transcript_2554/g.5899 Transcript_2554/m.5899 type:complete len:296 (-) Transcript_2554:351-1238(-)